MDEASPKKRNTEAGGEAWGWEGCCFVFVFVFGQGGINLNAHENVAVDKSPRLHSPAKTIACPQIHTSRGGIRDSPCISPWLAELGPPPKKMICLCPNI